MKHSDWRHRAHDAIESAIAEAKRQGLNGDDLEKFVRTNGYPFGLRENHPYKIWCSEVIAMLSERPHQPKPRKTEPKMLPLFDLNTEEPPPIRSAVNDREHATSNGSRESLPGSPLGGDG